MKGNLDNLIDDLGIYYSVSEDMALRKISLANKIGVYRIIRNEIKDIYSLEKGEFNHYLRLYRKHYEASKYERSRKNYQ